MSYKVCTHVFNTMSYNVCTHVFNTKSYNVCTHVFKTKSYKVSTHMFNTNARASRKPSKYWRLQKDNLFFHNSITFVQYGLAAQKVIFPEYVT